MDNNLLYVGAGAVALYCLSRSSGSFSAVTTDPNSNSSSGHGSTGPVGTNQPAAGQTSDDVYDDVLYQESYLNHQFQVAIKYKDEFGLDQQITRFYPAPSNNNEVALQIGYLFGQMQMMNVNLMYMDMISDLFDHLRNKQMRDLATTLYNGQGADSLSRTLADGINNQLTNFVQTHYDGYHKPISQYLDGLMVQGQNLLNAMGYSGYRVSRQISQLSDLELERLARVIFSRDANAPANWISENWDIDGRVWANGIASQEDYIFNKYINGQNQYDGYQGAPMTAQEFCRLRSYRETVSMSNSQEGFLQASQIEDMLNNGGLHITYDQMGKLFELLTIFAELQNTGKITNYAKYYLGDNNGVIGARDANDWSNTVPIFAKIQDIIGRSVKYSLMFWTEKCSYLWYTHSFQ